MRTKVRFGPLWKLAPGSYTALTRGREPAARVDVEPRSRGFVFLGRPFYGRWTPPLKLRQPVSNGLPSQPLKSKVTPIIPHRMDFSWYLRKPVERADNTLWGGVKPASRLSADPALTSSEWSRLLRQAATSR